MSLRDDYSDFGTSISELGGDASKLTGPASNLSEGDLVALAWGNHTEATEKLGVRDIQSIVHAFEGHPFRGNANSEVVGASCCCTCTPACCCTAGAVVDTITAAA